jgi:hypothetical protein
MGCKDGLIGDFVVIEEAIGSFSDLPIATSLGDGGSWMIAEGFSNQEEAFAQTQVAQFGIPEFDLSPVLSLVLRHRTFCS